MQPQVARAGITLGTGAAGFGAEGGSPCPYPTGLSSASDGSLIQTQQRASFKLQEHRPHYPGWPLMRQEHMRSPVVMTRHRFLLQTWDLAGPKGPKSPWKQHPSSRGVKKQKQRGRKEAEAHSWHILRQEEVWQGGGAVRPFRAGHLCHRLLG